MTWLWILFITGQVINAGNMNYHQDAGYYETTSYYSTHPSRKEVYVGKVAGTLAVYGATRLFPRYKKPVLIGANVVVWGFIYDDNKKGIAFKVRF